ncbi:MAG: TetR/AcrR family transcriptional regulator [Deltaproteobacteria bacterium]|nr:TetR/AcrR family transcriptional regulator [Deltaproteobacteria bacterium]
MTDQSVIIKTPMPKIAATARDAFYDTRRTEIAEAAVRLWAERGFDATSVAQVAEAAGISKGSFYLYFASKQALLEAVLQRYSLLPSIHRLAENLADATLEEAVDAFVRQAWRHLSEHRDLVLLALRELPTHVDQLQGVLERVFVPGNKLIADYLESRLGEARAREISLIVAGRGLIGMILMMFLSHSILDAGRFLPLGEDQIVSTIAQVFLHGVAGAKGSTAG